MSMAIVSSLLLAGAALPAADSAAIDVRVKEIFRPYNQPATTTRSSWDYPVFSAETAALIAHWKRVQPKDEPDELNDADWFCMCQDYDAKTFRATPSAARPLGPNVAEVQVRIDFGFDEPRNARLLLKKEANGWRLDDMFAPDAYPSGLKQSLHATIAADEALMRKPVKRRHR